MQSIRFLAGFLVLLVSCWINGASAQNTISYVSPTGSDTNSCTAASPCSSFQTALAVTARTGVIMCLGPIENLGGAGLAITKSITIDCAGAQPSFFHASDAITINITDGSDPDKAVYLRGLSLESYQGGGIRGVHILAANLVVLDNVNVRGESQDGVLDVRSTPGRLVVKNSIFVANKVGGIVVAGASGNRASVDNVTSSANGYGIAMGAGNSATVVRSVFTENTIGGVETDSGATIGLESVDVGLNQNGLMNSGTMFLSNSDIRFNTTGSSGTQPTSFGNNRVYGNSASGSFFVAGQQ